MTVLAKVDVYTQGAYGTGLEAVGYLDHALALMPPDQVGAQQVWWEKRTAIIYSAALAHDEPARVARDRVVAERLVAPATTWLTVM